MDEACPSGNEHLATEGVENATSRQDIEKACPSGNEHLATEGVENATSRQDIETESSKSNTAIEIAGNGDGDTVSNSRTSNQRCNAEKTAPAHNVEGIPSTEAGASWIKQTIDLLKDQWFLVALALLIAIASQVQVPLKHQEQKRTLTSYICIALIFFVTGSILDTKILLQNYARWKIHLFSQTLCFLMTSAVVFGLVSAVATNHHFMDPGLLVGMVFLSCVATTISSNVVMTRQAHGNQALTVVQTTVGNLTGVFITPALVIMYTSVDTWYNSILPTTSGHFEEIYRRVLKKLGLSIYLPLFVGQVTRYFFPKTCKKVFIDWNFNKLGSICLLVVLWATYDQAFATHSFDYATASNKVFVVFISVALWIVFFGITFFLSIIWLPKEDVVSLCYCVPAKGIAMGIPLSTALFEGIDLRLESKIQIPIVIYQGLQLAFGSILIPIFRRWIDRKEERDQEAGATSEPAVEGGLGLEKA